MDKIRQCGTYSAYCGGCHCEECTKASNDYQRKKRLAKVESLCGPGPWACYFCDEILTEFRRGYSAMHHLDHDHSNDVPENTVMVHKICHDRHHRTKESFTPEWKEKISQAKRQQWQEGIYANLWETRRANERSMAEKEVAG